VVEVEVVQISQEAVLVVVVLVDGEHLQEYLLVLTQQDQGL
jgi:hypothetical protein